MVANPAPRVVKPPGEVVYRSWRSPLLLVHTSWRLTCNSYSGLARDLDLLPRLIRYGMYGDSLSMQTNDDVFLLFQAK